MNLLSFAFLCIPGRTEKEALLLAESIRTFGGLYADASIVFLIPGELEELSVSTRAKVEAFDIAIVPFDIGSDTLQFPFAAKVFASAAAECWARDRTECLVWMDVGSLVLRQPDEMILPNDKALGYRPVDHTLIGSLFEQPLDPFWNLVYRECRVPEDRVFPMRTSVDQQTLRPYFNAGMLIVRPERGLLQRWQDAFQRLYRRPDFMAFYEENSLYKIFIHQAVLTGCILSKLRPEELLLLPSRVNYPLHMHEDYPPAERPEALSELVSLRYEQVFEDPKWKKRFSFDKQIRKWLAKRV